MADRIRLNLYATVPDGRQEEIKGMVKELVASARAEDPGTLSYEWFFTNEDETELQVLEVFESSEAVLSYFARAGDAEAAKRFVDACVVEKLEVCGDPTDELREMLDATGMPISYQARLDGFTR